MSEPKSFIAGTLQEWVREDEYAYGLWSYRYALIGPASKSIECTVDAGLVSVILASADTADWEEGRYAWTLLREKDNEAVHVAQGFFTIKANPLGVEGVADVRTHAEKMLAAIEARLEGRILSDHESYAVDGRSLSRIPIVELNKLRREYSWKVRQEKVRRGEVKRFTGPKVRLR